MLYFFIGIAGSGMSAIAQYLKGKGHDVCGSDRIFSKPEGQDTKQKLEKLGIACHIQGETLPSPQTDFVVISTAIEDTVYEYAGAKKMGLKIIHRSDLLAEICNQNYTIAVSGTSGKSTTTAMIYCILEKNGMSPSLISGAGLSELQKQGFIGNASVGKSSYLVIEADESDGTITKYKPQVGIILNIDKDHKEISELIPLFQTFKDNTQKALITNLDNNRSAALSIGIDFSCKLVSNNQAVDLTESISGISFYNKGTKFEIPIAGLYNVENAMAAITVARVLGITDKNIAFALKQYQGIYRRFTILKQKNGITIIDDYAHNPAKIAASITSAQKLSKRVLAWFQPHGFAPSKLIKNELIATLTNILRDNDQIFFSKIYYAGGTADKTISAQEFANAIALNGKKAFYIPERDDFAKQIVKIAQSRDIRLLMGARDPSLADFAKDICELL